MRHILLIGTAAACLCGCAMPSAHKAASMQRLSQFSPSAQAHVALAADASDRMLVVWDSRRQQGGKYGVLGRFLNADGSMASQETTINTHVDQHQMHPAVAMAADGTAWVVWTSWMQDGDQGSIVARHFDGRHWGQELAVNTTLAGHQREPVVAVGQGPTALVAWVSNDAATPRIVARLLTPAGPQGDEVVMSAKDVHASVPAVATLGKGWLLTWAQRTSEGTLSVEAAHCGPDGTPLASPVRVAINAIEPVVASNGTRAALAWLASDTHGWRVDMSFWPELAQPITLASSSAGQWISGVAIDVDESDGASVAWTIDKPVHDTFVRTVDRLGTLGDALQLAHGAHLEAARGTTRLHRARNGTLHAALSGKAGGDKKSAMLASTGAAGTATWELLELSVPDLTYALVQADVPIPPIFDPNFTPQPRSRTAQPRGGDHGFEGITYTGWTPPDPDLAAGPTHVVQVTNGAIAFFTHNGDLVFQDELEGSNGFWGSVGATSFVFDPEVLFDERSGRFFAMVNERSDNGGSYFLLAVSDDSNPEGAWHKYRLNMSHIDNDIDSPNMAVDEDTVYLACDMFGPDKYAVLMVPKAQVIAGQNVSGETELLMTGNGNQSFGLPRSTDDDPDVPQFMLQSSEGTNNGVSFSEIRIHAIIDPLGDPSRQTYDLSVPTYQYPSQVPQQGTSVQHYLFEPRFWSCVYRNGSIWAVHHVNESRARVRWYEIDMRSWPTSGQMPALAQWGELDLGSGVYTFFPAIAVDANDNAAIVFARGASNEYTSMWRAVRSSTDASGTFQAPVLVKSSSAPETSGRWGDYAGASAQPGGGGIWLAHEWRSSGAWSTWIDRAAMAPPLTVHVPADYPTIQSAIDAVPNGSIIEVSAGVWMEMLNLDGRSLTLIGEDPLTTIIDAGGDGLVIDLDNQGSGTLIEGFTITGGDAAWGAGVLVRGQPTIRNCHVTHNVTNTGGGILSLLAPGPLLEDVFFCDNYANHIYGPWVDGGGNVFEDACPGECLGDVDGDGFVNVKDVLVILANFGGDGAGDANGDGVVDVNDILVVIGAWGRC